MRRCPGTLALLLGLGVMVACSSAPDVVDVPRALPSRTSQYLLEPSVSDLLPEQGALVRQAHRLLLSGDLEAAGEQATRLPSGLAQKVLLTAQIAFAKGSYSRVLEAFAGLESSLEGSEAELLVFARAADLAGQSLAAFEAYRAQSSDLASRRAEALRSDAIAEASDRFLVELERGRVDLAEGLYSRLSEWAADAPETLAADLRLARANEDTLRELQALRSLRARTDLEGEELARLARLELDFGDPQSGVDLFTDLVEQDPGNPFYRDGLAAAKFRFRLDMLPNEVSSLVRDRELSRGEFASLLYWVVPGVRSDRTAAGEIVSDVLDHPYREAIVRVVNLGLMQVDDPARHRFAPDAGLPQGQALESLLRLPERLGVNPRCLASFKNNPRPSSEAVCSAATACGLLLEGEPCLAGSSLSGAQASESLRRALALLE